MRGSRVLARIRGGRAAPVAALLVVMVLVGSACSKGRGGTGATAYNVFVQKFTYHGMPASFKTGNIQINFSNKEAFSINHEMIVAQLPAGQTRDDVITSAKVPGCEGGGECESMYLHFGEIGDVETGATISNVFDLPPGDYFLACWQTGTEQGAEDGPPHASIGMVYSFKVTP